MRLCVSTYDQIKKSKRKSRLRKKNYCYANLKDYKINENNGSMTYKDGTYEDYKNPKGKEFAFLNTRREKSNCSKFWMIQAFCSHGIVSNPWLSILVNPRLITQWSGTFRCDRHESETSSHILNGLCRLYSVYQPLFCGLSICDMSAILWTTPVQ